MLTRIIQENYKLLLEKREKKHFYVTDAGKCKRQLYYAFNNTPESNSPDAESVLRFEFGKIAEQSLNNILEKAGVLREKQTRIEHKLNDKYELHGNIDQIIEVGGKLYVCECKSYYGYAQEKDLKEGKPNSGYVVQLGQYLYHLKTRVEPQGFLFYLSREYMNSYEFTVELKDKDIYCNGSLYGNIDQINEEYSNMIRYLEGNVIPSAGYDYKYSPIKLLQEVKAWSDNKKKTTITSLNKAIKGEQCDAVIGDWQCKYCNYKDLCLQSRNISLGYSASEAQEIKDIIQHA